MDEPSYDVFLSYARADEAVVKDVAQRLRANSLEPFFDQSHLRAGQRWQEALEKALRTSRSCAVFVGERKIDRWQNEEMRVAVDRSATYPEFRVIPVLLPGSPHVSYLPELLRRFQVVDLTSWPDCDDEYRKLLDGIGERTAAAPATAPASEVPAWNVPNRNAYFTGREDLLRDLETRLAKAGTAAITQAITGLGGIGKTQLAVEFCHRHRDDYDAVYWADASSVDTLQASYAELAVDRDPGKAGDPQAAAWFLRQLSRDARWLLVLDNADAPEEVRDLLPRTASGHVIVTTRAREPGLGGGEPLSVDVLPLELATDLVLTRARRDDGERDAARDLAEALGCLPLALEQAGAYLAHYSAPIADYSASFHKRRLKLVEEQAPERYHATVATTWEMSFQHVEEASPAAAEAMRACAFLAADGIPLDFFVSAGASLGPALVGLAEDDDPLAVHRQVEGPLTAFSLASFDRGTRSLSVHRLVREVIQERLRAEDRELDVFERVHRALETCFPEDPGAPASWSASALWFPHVRRCLSVWKELAEAPSWNPTALWHHAAYYAWAAGRASGAREFYESALSVRCCVLGEEHPDTLRSINNLAVTLGALGDASGARELHEAALKVRRRVLGEEHPDTLASMNNLALILRDLGDASGARKLHKPALKLRRRVLGEEHPDTLASMNNLALTLRDLGDVSGARELHEAALKVRRRVLGEEHPDTLASMNNLALILRDLGDASGARELEEAALSVRRRVLGEEHPDTLTAMNNLALTLSDLGDASWARELLESALSVRRRVLGEEHPDTLRSMNNLAALDDADTSSS